MVIRVPPEDVSSVYKRSKVSSYPMGGVCAGPLSSLGLSTVAVTAGMNAHIIRRNLILLVYNPT